MCGIFGIVGHVALETARVCLDRISHRGPDGWGLDAFDGCVLGHRRLAIFDVSDAGRQPMVSHSGRFVITYNGEVYNYIELRAELSAKGYRFQTDSDTEVVLQAFEVWGTDCLRRFNGMWAMAIWDTRERRLFLARDRFGKKPLFWTRTRQGLCFASEMKALFPLLASKTPHPELTRSSKRIMCYEGGETCLITEIQRFPAGHFALTSGSAPRPQRWWNTLDHLVSVPASFSGQCEVFRDLFMNACRLRMRSDVPLGVALSGGFDSSASLCCMARVARDHSRQPLQHWKNAFTASFPGTPLDEAAKAAAVATHVGADLHVVPVDPCDIPKTISRDLWLLEEQHLTLPSPFMRIYEAVRAHGVKVTLDGHGADELLAGYPFDFIHAMYDAHPWHWPRLARTFQRCQPDSPQFPRPSAINLVRNHLRNKATRQPPQAYAAPDDAHPVWQSMGILNRILYHATHYSVLPTLLRNYDRYSMASGVEIRMPFMDHRLVSFCFSLPWQSKLRGGYTKAVARWALAGTIPRSVAWDRTKLGFNAPFADWAKGPLRAFFQDTLHSRAFKDSDFVDPVTASRRFDALIETDSPTFAQAEACWTAFVPYFWEQAVLCEKGAPNAGPACGSKTIACQGI